MQLQFQPIKSPDLAALESLYQQTDGPSLSFLQGLLPRPTTRAWMLISSEWGVLAGAWYSVVSEEAELLDIRVSQAHRGQGLGRILLSKTLISLQAESVQRVYLEVRRSNRVAQNLYRRLAFSIIGERTNYYPSFDGREDAILMAVDFSVTR